MVDEEEDDPDFTPGDAELDEDEDEDLSLEDEGDGSAMERISDTNAPYADAADGVPESARRRSGGGAASSCRCSAPLNTATVNAWSLGSGQIPTDTDMHAHMNPTPTTISALPSSVRSTPPPPAGMQLPNPLKLLGQLRPARLAAAMRGQGKRVQRLVWRAEDAAVTAVKLARRLAIKGARPALVCEWPHLWHCLPPLHLWVVDVSDAAGATTFPCWQTCCTEYLLFTPPPPTRPPPIPTHSPHAGLIVARALRTIDRADDLGLRMLRQPAAEQMDYYYRNLLGDDWQQQAAQDLVDAVADVDAGYLTDDMVRERRGLQAAILRRLEVEEWDKERMRHFYYGLYGMGPWYWDMEERLHNPFFIGARGWNGPPESWIGENQVCRVAFFCLRDKLARAHKASTYDSECRRGR